MSFQEGPHARFGDVLGQGRVACFSGNFDLVFSACRKALMVLAMVSCFNPGNDRESQFVAGVPGSLV